MINSQYCVFISRIITTIILILFFAGCEDDNLVDYSVYKFQDMGSINYIVTDIDTSQTIIITGVLPACEGVLNSTVSKTAYGYSFYISRTSEDALSEIVLWFGLDSLNNVICSDFYSISFSITQLNGNGLIDGYGNTTDFISFDETASYSRKSDIQVVYDSINKRVAGSFFFQRSLDNIIGDTIKLSGNFDVQLYECLN